MAPSHIAQCLFIAALAQASALSPDWGSKSGLSDVCLQYLEQSTAYTTRRADVVACGADAECINSIRVQVRNQLLVNDPVFSDCMRLAPGGGENCISLYLGDDGGAFPPVQAQAFRAEIQNCANPTCKINVIKKYTARLSSDAAATLARCFEAFAKNFDYHYPAPDSQACDDMALTWAAFEGPLQPSFTRDQTLVFWFTHYFQPQQPIAVTRRGLFAACRKMLVRGITDPCLDLLGVALGASAEALAGAYLRMSPSQVQDFERCKVAMPLHPGKVCWSAFLTEAQQNEVGDKCGQCKCCNRKVYVLGLSGAADEYKNAFAMCSELFLYTPERQCMEYLIMKDIRYIQAPCQNLRPNESYEVCMSTEVAHHFLAMTSAEQAALKVKCQAALA